MNYHRREMMISAVHSTLKWCRPLTFVNGVPMRNQTIASPVKPFETFPGHLLRLNTAVATNRTKQVPGGNQINYDTSYSRTRRKLEAELNKNRSKENNGPPHTTDKKHSEEVRGLTALVSFPGSGNTWLRYLLQQSTGEWVLSCWTSSKRRISYSAGILTGSVYKDLGLKKSGFPAENICNASVSQWVIYITSTCPINTSVVLLIERCWLWKRTSGVAQPSKCSQRLFCWCAIPKVQLSRSLIGKARATLGLLR